MAKTSPLKHLTEDFLDRLDTLLAEGKPVNLKVPGWGRIYIERKLPFLCLYRKPPSKPDAGAQSLVTTEASFLQIRGSNDWWNDTNLLLQTLISRLSREFGRFLLLEFWTAMQSDEDDIRQVLHEIPQFIVYCEDDLRNDWAVPFGEYLVQRKIARKTPEVKFAPLEGMHPDNCRVPLTRPVRARLHCDYIGIEVVPIFNNASGEEVFPLILRSFQQGLSRAVKKAAYHYMRVRTALRPKHFQALGKSAFVKSVWEVDQRLAGLCRKFDFLLMVTPVNTEQAWNEFKRNQFEKAPVFVYRHYPVDPVMLKRELYDIPLERVDDPTLVYLFREKQAEIDKLLTLLLDRNTRRFPLGSVQLYGPVSTEVRETAEAILFQLQNSRIGGRVVDAGGFHSIVQAELERFRAIDPRVQIDAVVSRDIPAGILVSGNIIHIGQSSQIPRHRIRGLLAHEVDTHLLTYLNGKSQKFQLLSAGFAGYDTLQEGLAVLGEYLVGELSRARMRLLAVRVLSIVQMLDGAEFVDVFRRLVKVYGFTAHAAFKATMRIFRGGGLTKDALYLQGFLNVLKYLADGGEPEILWTGKFDLRHVRFIRELIQRGVVTAPPFKPGFLDMPTARERLAVLREGGDIVDLMKRRIK